MELLMNGEFIQMIEDTRAELDMLEINLILKQDI